MVNVVRDSARTSHIGPTTPFYFLVTSISRRDTFRGMIQINLVGHRDLTILTLLNCVRLSSCEGAAMTETRKLAAILAADVAGYSKLAGADEERTLARLRALRSDLIDPTIALHHGRVVKRTGDGVLIEFRSVVDAVRCAIEVQNGMLERNAGLPPERRIEFRIGIHLGDVVEESDGDLMGDGVNIAARLEGIADPGGICLSEDAYRQVRDRVMEGFTDLGEKELKNIARPVRAYTVQTGSSGQASASQASASEKSGLPRLSIVVLPFANLGGDPSRNTLSMA